MFVHSLFIKKSDTSHYRLQELVLKWRIRYTPAAAPAATAATSEHSHYFHVVRVYVKIVTMFHHHHSLMYETRGACVLVVRAVIYTIDTYIHVCKKKKTKAEMRKAPVRDASPGPLRGEVDRAAAL